MLLLMGWLGGADSARILAFTPLPGKSHQAVIVPLLRELATRGHEVTAVTPFAMDKPPSSYKEILIPDRLQQMTSSEYQTFPLIEEQYLILIPMNGSIGKVPQN